MTQQWKPALLVLLVLTGITGVLYPLAVTGIAQIVFPKPANGSLVSTAGRTVGSDLIGQPFTSPQYFWGRPSATSPAYNAAASSGSNLGPANPALETAVRERVEQLRAADPGNQAPIPVDLVTASASGLDPHLSIAGALYQIPRVARARGMTETELNELVDRHVEGRTFGLLGEPRVNVLALNLALDSTDRH